jgi:uncharacterized membrane protein
MWTDVLAVVFLVLVGVLAGVLFAVDRAVVPALAALPASGYRTVHRLLDPRFDPLMPHLSKVALAAGTVLVVFGDGLAARVAFGVAVAGVAGVAVVSEAFNVRMNREIDRWDGERPPERWQQVRARWGRANRVRTAFSLVAFLAAGVAVVA